MKNSEKTLGDIEKTQAKLRESIKKATDLCDQSDKLIKKHRREMKAERKPPGGPGPESGSGA